MATERCSKCGSEMVMCDLVPISATPGPEEGTASMAYRYKTRCSLDPKDCRIKYLERVLLELLLQIYKCDLTDRHGHDFTMNKAFCDARAVFPRTEYSK